MNAYTYRRDGVKGTRPVAAAARAMKMMFAMDHGALTSSLLLLLTLSSSAAAQEPPVCAVSANAAQCESLQRFSAVANASSADALRFAAHLRAQAVPSAGSPTWCRLVAHRGCLRGDWQQLGRAPLRAAAAAAALQKQRRAALDSAEATLRALSKKERKSREQGGVGGVGGGWVAGCEPLIFGAECSASARALRGLAEARELLSIPSTVEPWRFAPGEEGFEVSRYWKAKGLLPQQSCEAVIAAGEQHGYADHLDTIDR